MSRLAQLRFIKYLLDDEWLNFHFHKQRTPSKSALGRGGQLADYVPRTSPMVPAIIVHCVNELDTRGLHEVGLYRIPGSEKEVRKHS